MATINTYQEDEEEEDYRKYIHYESMFGSNRPSFIRPPKTIEEEEEPLLEYLKSLPDDEEDSGKSSDDEGDPLQELLDSLGDDDPPSISVS